MPVNCNKRKKRGIVASSCRLPDRRPRTSKSAQVQPPRRDLRRFRTTIVSGCTRLGQAHKTMPFSNFGVPAESKKKNKCPRTPRLPIDRNALARRKIEQPYSERQPRPGWSSFPRPEPQRPRTTPDVLTHFGQRPEKNRSLRRGHCASVIPMGPQPNPPRRKAPPT